jgi:hypothetical protein
MKQGMDQTCPKARENIENDESDRAQKVFYVVTKNPEIEHIENQVKNSPVHKHRDDECQRGREPGERLSGIHHKKRQSFKMGNFVRNGTHFVDKILKPLGRKQLIKKDYRIQSYKYYRDIWDAGGRIIILKRNKHIYPE